MLDSVEKLFGTRDPYEVFKINSKDASDPKKLRSSYLRAALVYHPDKTSPKDKETSTQKFQVLTKIYEVLKDDDNRKAYNETGCWPDENSKDFDFNIFSRINEDTITEFKKYYQGSDEEDNDIKKLYEKHKGNILKIFDDLFFANILDDFERIELKVAELIEKNELKKIPPPRSFLAQKKRQIDKAKKEAKEAAQILQEMRKKKGGTSINSDEDLRSTILARREVAGKSFLDSLEEKYSTMEKKGPKPKKPRRK